MNYLGDFAEDATVRLMFNTFTSDDPSASSTITNFINTDVHIHKDNGLTQRNNAAGITVSVDFDGITGSHMIEIDTNDNTVAGFWVTGSHYFVRIEGTTVDAATINVVVGQFSIENRYNPVTDYDGPTKAEMDTAHGLLATEAKQDIIDTNVDQIETAVITNAAGTDIAADIIALKAETVLIVADTGELQTDDIPGTLSTMDGKLATIDNLIDTEIAAIITDTEDIQSRLPAALAGAYMSSDAAAISGSTAAADNLEASAEVIVVAATAAGTLSTTQMTTNLTEATNDHYNGRIVIWTSGVLIGQASDITDYVGATKLVQYTAVTEAPGDGDTFVIV